MTGPDESDGLPQRVSGASARRVRCVLLDSCVTVRRRAKPGCRGLELVALTPCATGLSKRRRTPGGGRKRTKISFSVVAFRGATDCILGPTVLIDVSRGCRGGEQGAKRPLGRAATKRCRRLGENEYQGAGGTLAAIASMGLAASGKPT
jgi:hypothetical protein